MNYRKGFTLIEILIIFGISSVILGVSVNSFGSYNNTQKFRSAVSDVVNELNSARSRAISQVKPTQCSSPLDGYEVKITTSSRDYEQSAICGGSPFDTKQKKLPPQLIFTTGSDPNVAFNVSDGTVNAPRVIYVTGFGKTSVININTVGIISINSTEYVPPPSITQAASTPGITQTPQASTVVAISLSSTTPTTINVVVTGTNCVPLGQVRLYKEDGLPFNVAVLSGVNPKTGSASYSMLSNGPHRIRAQYFTGSSCPNASSNEINVVR